MKKGEGHTKPVCARRGRRGRGNTISQKASCRPSFRRQNRFPAWSQIKQMPVRIFREKYKGGKRKGGGLFLLRIQKQLRTVYVQTSGQAGDSPGIYDKYTLVACAHGPRHMASFHAFKNFIALLSSSSPRPLFPICPRRAYMYSHSQLTGKRRG